MHAHHLHRRRERDEGPGEQAPDPRHSVDDICSRAHARGIGPSATTHMSSSPLSRKSDVSKPPSFVERLDLVILASLAVSTRTSLTGQILSDVSCTVDSPPVVGGYNVVFFITFSDGVRWVCRIPITEWSSILEERLRMDLACLQFIERRTSIPVPTVHAFDTSNSNALGRPYTFMSVVSGKKLCKLWFDRAWFTEERRLRFWRSLASCVSQLAQFEFQAIGTPICDAEAGTYSVVPFVSSRPEIDDGDTSVPAGPFTSVQEHLLAVIAKQIANETDASNIAMLRLLQPYVYMLPEPDLSGPPFVMSHSDLNYQNIFVDDEGNVTAILDWDDMAVGPRQSGCCRYPSWITRDWDPTMYGYTYRDSDDEVCLLPSPFASLLTVLSGRQFGGGGDSGGLETNRRLGASVSAGVYRGRRPRAYSTR
jgi:aminoglycoside phosphotransferase (APT) family kinase protein